MRPALDLDIEKKVIRLYQSDKLSIHEILEETGVKSEQTLYAILDRNHIPIKSVKKTISARRSISFADDVWEKLKDQKNLSKFINDVLREYYSE